MDTHALSTQELKDVPETLLYPLKSRYIETKKEHGILSDPKSVEILDALDYNPSLTNLYVISQLGICLRTMIFDEQVSKFLQANPDSVVINIGCGLDTRFPRLDNGQVLWFDLDVPEAIRIRRHFFQETDRHHFIASSVLDPAWTEAIPKGKKILFIIEGLTFYFSEEENRRMLAIMRKNCPGSDCLMELMAEWNANMLIKASKKKKYDDELDNKAGDLVKWGINKTRDMEKWEQGISFVKEWFVPRRKLSVFPWKIRILFFLIPLLSKATKIAHIRFS